MGMFGCCGPSWLTIIVSSFLAWVVLKIATRIKYTLEIQEIVKRKKDVRVEGFKKAKLGIRDETPEDIKIQNLSDEELLEGLQTRKLTAEKVLDVFIRKAYKVQLAHNCITEFIPDAMEWARELDAMKEVKGPLHGLTVSIKDNCGIKGMDCTLGLGKKCFKPAPDHAVIVKVLMDLGAIPFCKTNVPQTLLSYGCTNPIFGMTTNFLNANLSPGGSSGGESTLIAGGGSIIGVGSDIGGSVRIPAHFTGVVGFKPTKDRLSGLGFEASLPNVVGVSGVPGLLAKNLDTLTKVFKLLVEQNRQHNYDPVALPISWNNELFESKSKLRIGYFTSLSYFPLIGDTEEVVLKAKAALEAQGHTLVPFEMPDSFKMMEIVADMSFADHGSHLCSAWNGEVIPLSLALNFLVFNTPVWLRKVVASILELPIPYLHSRRGAVFLRGGAGVSKDLWNRVGDRKKMIADIIGQWKSLNLDILLCPTFPFPSVPSKLAGRMQSAVVYTMIWNLFDFPSGVVKFGHESGKNIDAYNHENDFMLRPASKAVREAIGMPLSVQIVGLPFQDEMVLKGMKEVEKVASFTTKP